MEKIIFKSIYALIGVALVLVLYVISTKLDNNRYQITQGSTIIDTKTGQLYIWEEDSGYTELSANGKYKKIKSLPKH